MQPPSLTIGVEEKYQIVDPQTRELRAYITQMLEAGQLVLAEQVKPELHQSIAEIGTTVCHTRRPRYAPSSCGCAPPSSSWPPRTASRSRRRARIPSRRGSLRRSPRWSATSACSKTCRTSRQLLIFGTHIHVGIEDQDFLIDAMNVVRYMLPHLLCLSSSPLLDGPGGRP